MRTINIELPVDIAYDQAKLSNYLKNQLNIDPNDPVYFQIQKRSLDARRAPLKSRLKIVLFDQFEELQTFQSPCLHLPILSRAETIIIVGAGPAGLFAALRAISLGLKPIVLERGQAVRERRQSLAILNRTGQVDPESNYCFGEGGAGTYSDGKLYTRSKKRGSVRAILQLLADHGAPEEILYEAQPHIGSNRLPKVIQAIRNTIINKGGEVWFGAKVTQLLTSFHQNKRMIKGVVLANGQELMGLSIFKASTFAYDIQNKPR